MNVLVTSVCLLTVSWRYVFALGDQTGVFMDNTCLSVNNGPLAYREDLGQGNFLTGGTSPSGDGFGMATTSTVVARYQSMHVPGVRPNDLGGPFDLRCMFPIHTISDIPRSSSTFEEIRDDPRWNWTSSDAVFASLIEHGFAPYLKLASREWVSGQQTGFSFVDEAGFPQYVVAPQSLVEFCVNWPFISPIMESIGDKLVLAVVERYNNETLWKRSLEQYQNGSVSGPPLEWKTWAKVTNATVGVELQNEYNFLTCLNTGSGETNTLAGWEENCGGAPFIYNGKYWDGTPEAAHESFVSQAIAIKRRFPGIRVGGPAIGTGPSFGLAPDIDGNLPAGGAALDWVRSFLQKVRKATEENDLKILDWFSWHAYTSCVRGTGVVDCSAENPTSMQGIANRMRTLLDSEGFDGMPMVISEHNANFKVNGGNTFPGNVIGAAVTAANIISLVLSKDSLGIAGAYIVNGLDGPFIPYNQNSFPLSCTPEYIIQEISKNESMNPSRITFSGSYVNDCMYGDGLIGAMSINTANGMGLLYSNGDRKPSALVYEDIMSEFIYKHVKSLASVLPASVTGMYTGDQNDTGCNSIILVNADPFSYSPMLPPLSEMLPNSTNIDESRIKVSQIVQHIRGLSDITLPNNISNLGTVQVEGQMVEMGFLETFSQGLLQGNRSIRLPPAGVAMFTAICRSMNAG